MKTVCIVEDDSLIREGLVQIINREADVSVCGELGVEEDSFKEIGRASCRERV